ncbi:hypothetical protein OG563_42975 [Nocardia vinacea]|uniref:Uncharacterized protein n=1 Tax=Nocardia vinacea TaxID=96468 RepID=A0ABZ1YR82_9NOCA
MVLDEPHPVRFVRVTAGRLPVDRSFAGSRLRVFGHGNLAPPQAVTARAHRGGDRAAHLEWDAIAGARLQRPLRTTPEKR